MKRQNLSAIAISTPLGAKDVHGKWKAFVPSYRNVKVQQHVVKPCAT